MLQMGDTVGPRYTAPKISAISYLFRTFSLLIMGDTERRVLLKTEKDFGHRKGPKRTFGHRKGLRYGMSCYKNLC